MGGARWTDSLGRQSQRSQSARPVQRSAHSRPGGSREAAQLPAEELAAVPQGQQQRLADPPGAPAAAERGLPSWRSASCTPKSAPEDRRSTRTRRIPGLGLSRLSPMIHAAFPPFRPPCEARSLSSRYTRRTVPVTSLSFMKILYVGSERTEAQAVAEALHGLDQEIKLSWACRLAHAVKWLDDNPGVAALIVEAQ